jgi:hypothetical protein
MRFASAACVDVDQELLIYLIIETWMTWRTHRLDDRATARKSSYPGCRMRNALHPGRIAQLQARHAGPACDAACL